VGLIAVKSKRNDEFREGKVARVIRSAAAASSVQMERQAYDRRCLASAVHSDEQRGWSECMIVAVNQRANMHLSWTRKQSKKFDDKRLVLIPLRIYQ
jgi:hypothetical protein